MSFTNDEIGELWLLLFLDPSKLTNYELDRLLEHEEGLRNRIQHLWRTFPESLEAMRRYRARKAELSRCSIEELRAILGRIRSEVAHAEPLPADSDASIILEIFEDRKINGSGT